MMTRVCLRGAGGGGNLREGGGVRGELYGAVPGAAVAGRVAAGRLTREGRHPEVPPLLQRKARAVQLDLRCTSPRPSRPAPRIAMVAGLGIGELVGGEAKLPPKETE